MSIVIIKYLTLENENTYLILIRIVIGHFNCHYNKFYVLVVNTIPNTTWDKIALVSQLLSRQILLRVAKSNKTRHYREKKC